MPPGLAKLLGTIAITNAGGLDHSNALINAYKYYTQTLTLRRYSFRMLVKVVTDSVVDTNI